jgi:hypothetical protein
MTVCKEVKMDIDSLEHHIRTVDNRHTQIARQIEQITAQKSWDEFQVETLKKEKLKLKDELTILYRRRHELMNEHHYE